jgi:hypothetical protein
MQSLKQDISKLIRVKTYSDINKISTTEVYRRITDKKLKAVVIDGIKFIVQ